MVSYRHLIKPQSGLLSEIHSWKIAFEIGNTTNEAVLLYRYYPTGVNEITHVVVVESLRNFSVKF